MEPGCVGMGGHSLCCPWGSRSPVGTAGWLKGYCRSGMGTARGRAQLRLPPGQLSGSGWLSTVGEHFGTELQSPALLSVGIQRAWMSQELLCVMCRSRASRRPGHGGSRGAVPAPGARARCWLSRCASTLRLRGHGKVLAWPVGGPPQPCHLRRRGPWGSHPPTPLCAAGAGAGKRLPDPVCQVPGETGMKGLRGPSSPLQRCFCTFKASGAP